MKHLDEADGGGTESEKLPQNSRCTDRDGSEISTRCTSVLSSSSQYQETKTANGNSGNSSTQDEEQIVIQNISNKRNEKLSKPCQNGFCYCFTSDSDEFRLVTGKTDVRHKPRIRDKDAKQSENPKVENRLRTLEKSKRRISLPVPSERALRYECYGPDSGRCTKIKRSHSFMVKSSLKESAQSSDSEPLIHIIQEIHKNVVISEVRINRGKIISKRHKKLNNLSTHHEEAGPSNIETRDDSITPQDILPIQQDKELMPSEETIPSNFLQKHDKSHNPKGGHLLRKRLGSESSGKCKHFLMPPKKPPRSFSSCSDSNRTINSLNEKKNKPDKKINETMLQVKVPEVTSEVPKQKTFPPVIYPNISNEKELLNNTPHPPTPSCPSLSQVTTPKYSFKTDDPANSKIGWVRPNIGNMLNCENGNQRGEFISSQLGAQGQSFGWVPPPKLDIDTVDNVPKYQDNGLHNFAANMENKSTPVKNELNSQGVNNKFLFKDQLWKSPDLYATKSNEVLPIKKLSPIQESGREGNFRRKALMSTRNFWEISRNKIMKLIRKNRRDSNAFRSIGIQTSYSDLLDIKYPRKLQYEDVDKNEDRSIICNKHANPLLTSPCHSQIRSPSPNIFPQEPFNFNRTVESPKLERHFVQKAKFSPKKMFTALNPRAQENIPQSYKSYDSELVGDLTMATMNDILGSIRAKLEESDKVAVTTFTRNRNDTIGSTVEVESPMQISAIADVHQEPLYAEIRDHQRQTVFLNPVVKSSSEDITSLVISDNPNAIYAEVKKKHRDKPKSQSYNNVHEKDSPPKSRNISKSDLSHSTEAFLDNLFSPKKDNSSSQFFRAHNKSFEDVSAL